MHKFDGLKLASFIVGIIVPIGATIFLLNKTVAMKTPAAPAETVGIVASTVDTFAVDYDMYGSMYIGENLIRCEVMNNAGNSVACKVYLVDENNVRITDEEELRPSYHVSVLDTTWSADVAGEYVVTLIYEIETNGGTSIIRCPYTILLNGGNTNVVR